MSLSRGGLQRGIAVFIIVALMGWHAWWATRGWRIPGMSGHEFRQAQTAVTIQAMKVDGFRLDYSTPILGKPWSIPFEFPIYEGLATAVSNHCDLSVVQAGRWVSLIAFYLSIPAFVLLLRAAGFSTMAAALGVAPVLFAPVFLLYSRAVLIESTALCTAAWFLCFLVRYRLERKWWQFAALMIFGVLAVLVKSTTWAVFCLPWAVWGAIDLWRARQRGWRAWTVIAEDVFLIGIPLLVVGFSWVWMTDQIKLLNPIGSFLTSDKLTGFNFGTWAQRFEAKTWQALGAHATAAVMPWWGLVVAGIGLIFVPTRVRVFFALALVGFVGGPLVFMNLYAIHDYYFYASGAFACLAAGAVGAGLWDAKGAYWRAVVGAALVVGVCTGEFFLYQRDFYRIQVSDNSGNFGLTDAIKRLTKPGDVVVMHAPDWSSIVAFRSERRMLMIPDSQMYYHADRVQQSVEMLHDESVPLVIFWGESRIHVDWTLQRIRELGLAQTPLFTWGDEATVYAAGGLYQGLREKIEREQDYLPGVKLDARGTVPGLKPPEPVTAAMAEGMTNLDPKPTAVALPFGLDYRFMEGVKYLFAHAPTEVYFTLPPGASRVEIGYRMDPGVYGKKDFDGVYVVLEVREPNKRTATIHQEWLTPDGNQKPRHLTVPLAGHREGTLVVRMLPGPANNNAYDWSLLEYLRIR